MPRRGETASAGGDNLSWLGAVVEGWYAGRLPLLLGSPVPPAHAGLAEESTGSGSDGVSLSDEDAAGVVSLLRVPTEVLAPEQNLRQAASDPAWYGRSDELVDPSMGACALRLVLRGGTAGRVVTLTEWRDLARLADR